MADIPESTKMLPCPHCGKEDAFVERSDYSDETEADAAAYENGDAEPGEMAARRAWNTRAAPPAMDREAVELDWRLVAKLAGEHGVRYRTNRAFEQFVTAILSTLSADAIRQGEYLRALSDRATPGPWAWEQCGEKEDAPVVGTIYGPDEQAFAGQFEQPFDAGDLDFHRTPIFRDVHANDGCSASSNAAFAVAAVNFVRKVLATPASHASDGGKA